MAEGKKQTEHARDLRRGQTDAERALWARLQNRQLCGAKFRRQEPLGPYIVDFVCFDKRVVVEVDGGQHDEEADRRKDAVRTAWLEGEGYRVLRFWNNEVLGNMEGVLTVIMEAVG